MRPERSCRTWAAVVGEGLVDVFAEGAARGIWAVCIKAKARRDEGMRAPKVGRDALTWGASGDGVGRGSRMVSAPGQNRWING